MLAAAACAAAITLASCASLQHNWDQGNVTTVADLINSGQSARLAAMSSTPFLVDGEIVALKSDVAGFWGGIIKAGYKVDKPVLDQASVTGPDSYKQFADTLEVKALLHPIREERHEDPRTEDVVWPQGVLLIIKDGWFSKRPSRASKDPTSMKRCTPFHSVLRSPGAVPPTPCPPTSPTRRGMSTRSSRPGRRMDAQIGDVLNTGDTLKTGKRRPGGAQPEGCHDQDRQAEPSSR